MLHILLCLVLFQFAIYNSTALFPKYLNDFEKYDPLLSSKQLGLIRYRSNEIDYRLPTDIRPINYNLKLKPYFDEKHEENKNFTFDGDVTIEVEVAKTTNKIYLHHLDLSIDKNSVQVSKSVIVDQTVDEIRDFYIIHLNQTLVFNETYTISMKFSGKLNDLLEGFYRSHYINNRGEKTWLASTQFESTNARRAFPCFDEPSFKATFEIKLDIPENYNAISNMPEIITIPDFNGRKTITFKKSIKMSTYLVAFVVSEYESFTKESTLLTTIWTRDKLIEYAEFTWDIAYELMKRIEDFVSIRFQLPKIDHISIPQFANEAMENWGLITYEEVLLIFQPKVSTSANKQSIATIISHELGHQWFGNQVSPLWWSYTWLNEGFANYFQHYGTGAALPEWRILEQCIQSMQAAFRFDSSNNTHPMTADVQSPAEINENFDIITYSKAEAVIRMIEHVLTTEVFRSGLNKYLVDKNQSTAEASDLWRNLQIAYNESGLTQMSVITVEELGNSWSTQAGYPLITVKNTYEPVNILEISQERFFADKNNMTDNTKWIVPLNYVTKSKLDFIETIPMIWLSNQTYRLKYPSEDFVLFNKHFTGYYRINYDDKNWIKLIEFLIKEDFTKIPPVNRAQLVDDALNLAQGGYLAYSIVLNVTKYLSQEDDYIPWYSAITALQFLDEKLVETPSYKPYKKYQAELVEVAYKEVNGLNETETDSHITRLLRNVIAKRACDFGHTECRKSANQILKSLIENNKFNHISPDLQTVVYCGGLRNGDLSDWAKMFLRYFWPTIHTEEKMRILTGLGCIENEHILNEFLSMIVTSDENTFINKRTAFSSVYNSGPFGLQIALNFMKYNFTLMKTNMDRNDIGDILINIGNKLGTSGQQKQFNEIKNLAEENYKIYFETENKILNDNIAWNNKYEPEIRKWFGENKNNGASQVSGTSVTFFVLFLTIYFILY